jgi:hypothetical protein
MNLRTYVLMGVIATGLAACSEQPKPAAEAPKKEEPVSQRIIGEDGKLYQSEQFADLRVLHYYIPQWDSLDHETKTVCVLFV